MKIYLLSKSTETRWSIFIASFLFEDEAKAYRDEECKKFDEHPSSYYIDEIDLRFTCSKGIEMLQDKPKCETCEMVFRQFDIMRVCNQRIAERALRRQAEIHQLKTALKEARETVNWAINKVRYGGR